MSGSSPCAERRLRVTLRFMKSGGGSDTPGRDPGAETPPQQPVRDETNGIPDTVELPMDGVLDLHTFRPRDVKDVVLEYVEECRRRGIRRIRIVHGKGIGQLREIVHRTLKDHPGVESYRLAGSGLGGWGATLVDLRGNPD